jgi:hypothetical protein
VAERRPPCRAVEADKASEIFTNRDCSVVLQRFTQPQTHREPDARCLTLGYARETRRIFSRALLEDASNSRSRARDNEQ